MFLLSSHVANFLEVERRVKIKVNSNISRAMKNIKILRRLQIFNTKQTIRENFTFYKFKHFSFFQKKMSP